MVLVYKMTDCVISSNTPSVVIAMNMAVSIDYALFLFSRLNEERRMGAELEQAVETMLESSGHSVLGSGSTLIICFLSLTGMPVELLQTLGVSVAWGIVMSIVINL